MSLGRVSNYSLLIAIGLVALEGRQHIKGRKNLQRRVHLETIHPPITNTQRYVTLHGHYYSTYYTCLGRGERKLYIFAGIGSLIFLLNVWFA